MGGYVKQAIFYAIFIMSAFSLVFDFALASAIIHNHEMLNRGIIICLGFNGGLFLMVLGYNFKTICHKIYWYIFSLDSHNWCLKHDRLYKEAWSK
jgi:hypothetical protein